MEEISNKFEKLKLNRMENDSILEVTVPTGLESVVVNEILEKNLSVEDLVFYGQGRVYFCTKTKNFDKVVTLRSVDNVNLVADIVKNMKFEGNKEKDLETIISILDIINIPSYVKQWAIITKYDGIINPTKQQHDDARIQQDIKFLYQQKHKKSDSKQWIHNILKYRVTCERVGKNHSFSSNEAAHKFGGIVNDKYLWIVALSDWNLNIFLRIQDNDAMILLKITEKSLHRRSLIDFGPTSLRPTICYGMLSLANLQPGEHMIDPLCGSGSIPIECMYAYPNVIVSCGDIHHRAVDRSRSNISAQKTNHPKPSMFWWNSAYLPYANHSVDAIVSDLPFGKRSGTKKNNTHLYKKLIKEFARVLKPGTGRIVLLTKDHVNLYTAMEQRKNFAPFWRITKTLRVNVGALKCHLIVAYTSDNVI